MDPDREVSRINSQSAMNANKIVDILLEGYADPLAGVGSVAPGSSWGGGNPANMLDTLAGILDDSGDHSKKFHELAIEAACACAEAALNKHMGALNQQYMAELMFARKALKAAREHSKLAPLDWKNKDADYIEFRHRRQVVNRAARDSESYQNTPKKIAAAVKACSMVAHASDGDSPITSVITWAREAGIKDTELCQAIESVVDITQYPELTVALL